MPQTLGVILKKHGVIVRKSGLLHQRKRSQESLSDEWATRKELVDLLSNKYKIYPKLDVCATKRNRKCKRYFSRKKNALEQSWKYDAWMNLPNSIAQKFIVKAYNEWKKNNINILAIMPINATVTRAGVRLLWNKSNPKIYPLLPTPSFLYNNKPVENSARNRYCIVIWKKRKTKSRLQKKKSKR